MDPSCAIDFHQQHSLPPSLAPRQEEFLWSKSRPSILFLMAPTRANYMMPRVTTMIGYAPFCTQLSEFTSHMSPLAESRSEYLVADSQYFISALGKSQYSLSIAAGTTFDLPSREHYFLFTLILSKACHGS